MPRGSFALLVVLALAAAMALTAATSHAKRPGLTERIVAAQPALQSRKDEPVDARELAEAIASVPRVTPEWAALLLTVGHHESALSARIAANNCRPLECDGGKAFGIYQAHKNTLNADVWGSPDVRVQTLEAARALRGAFYRCNGKGAPRVDWVQRTLNAYAGLRCDATWSGLTKRLATFNRVRARL